MLEERHDTDPIANVFLAIPVAAQPRAGGIRLIRLNIGPLRCITAIRWGRPQPAGMIGSSFAFPIGRGDIPAKQNSAEHGPRPMLNGILFSQLLAPGTYRNDRKDCHGKRDLP